MPKFSKRSQDKLNTTHPDLIKLFNRVIEHYDCTVLCGHRNKEDQETAYKKRRTKVHYPNSKHNSQPSMAVDIVPYPVDWDDLERFHDLALVVKHIASELDIKVRWGGNFSKFFDGPHWELI